MIYDSIISIDLVNRKAANLMNGNQQLDANTQSAIENYKVIILDQKDEKKIYIIKSNWIVFFMYHNIL